MAFFQVKHRHSHRSQSDTDSSFEAEIIHLKIGCSQLAWIIPHLLVGESLESSSCAS